MPFVAEREIERHTELKAQLIKSFKELILGGGRLSHLEKSAALMEFANFAPADLSCSSDELYKFDILVIVFADLHYRLQKENPNFRSEVSFHEEFTKDNIKIVRYECESDLELSSESLSKIQLDPDQNDEENHQKIGKSLREYFNELENNYVSDEKWGLKIKTLKMYAGLPVSPYEDASSGNELGVLELVLEITERIYLLKANQAQSKSVETNTSGLLILSPQGQQVVNPSLEKEDQKGDAEDKIRVVSHRRTFSQ